MALFRSRSGSAGFVTRGAVAPLLFCRAALFSNTERFMFATGVPRSGCSPGWTVMVQYLVSRPWYCAACLACIGDPNT